MSEFDAKLARTKRPMPIWGDAFIRDTGLLEADEVGAYVKILMAMWASRTVSLPNDPRKLARAAGVSVRLWNSRVWPSIKGCFSECSEGVIHVKLREDADFVEKSVKAQSDRKQPVNSRTTQDDGSQPGSDERPINSVNALKTNNQHQSADKSTDKSTVQPTQQPNNPTYKTDDVARARDEDRTHRENLLEAIGADPTSGVIGPNGAVLGSQADMAEVRKWSEAGLSEAEQIAEVARVMARRRAGTPPPRSFSYFSQPMADLVAAKARPMPAASDRQAGGPTDSDRERKIAKWKKIAGASQ